MTTVKLEVCQSNIDRATFKKYWLWVVFLTTIGNQDDPKKLISSFSENSSNEWHMFFTVITVKNY